MIGISIDSSVYALAGVDNGVHLEVRRIRKRCILNYVVETAPIPASFERPVLCDLVIDAEHGFVLAVGLNTMSDWLPWAQVHVFNQGNTRSRVRHGWRRRRSANEIGSLCGRPIGASPVVSKGHADI